MSDAARDLYLDLVKKSVTNLVYIDAEEWRLPLPNSLRTKLLNLINKHGEITRKPVPADRDARSLGKDWSPIAHTMVGLKRLDSVQHCVEDALKNNIPGDLIETGVWRGGTSIFMRAILKAYGITDRKVWVCDSFEGLPPPNPDEYPEDEGDELYKYDALAVSQERVAANFAAYDLLDDQVEFVKGWFKDTMPALEPRQYAVARLDGDMYESTMDVIKVVYPRLSVGGYLVVDDYGDFPSCRAAITDYREEHGIDDEIVWSDWTGVYWQKTK